MVGIVIIMAGVSFAVFSALRPSLQLGSVSRGLITDFRYAQQMAVTEQVNHGVHFSTSTDTYQILRYGTTTEEVASKSLPEAIDFQEIAGFSDNEVVFNPYGAVQETGTVVLVNTAQESKTIEVRPSGFVRLKK